MYIFPPPHFHTIVLFTRTFIALELIAAAMRECVCLFVVVMMMMMILENRIIANY